MFCKFVTLEIIWRIGIVTVSFEKQLVFFPNVNIKYLSVYIFFQYQSSKIRFKFNRLILKQVECYFLNIFNYANKLVYTHTVKSSYTLRLFLARHQRFSIDDVARLNRLMRAFASIQPRYCIDEVARIQRFKRATKQRASISLLKQDECVKKVDHCITRRATKSCNE